MSHDNGTLISLNNSSLTTETGKSHQITFMYNFCMFHAALYRIADKDKTKRGYSNCTDSNDSAAYTLLQMTKGGNQPDVITFCDGTCKYDAFGKSLCT